MGEFVTGANPAWRSDCQNVYDTQSNSTVTVRGRRESAPLAPLAFTAAGTIETPPGGPTNTKTPPPIPVSEGRGRVVLLIDTDVALDDVGGP